MSSYLYHVIRQTTDFSLGHNGFSWDIRGVYWTLQEANAAVRRDLPEDEDYDEDGFAGYSEEINELGMVEVDAEHGFDSSFADVHLRVYIEKRRIPRHPATLTPNIVWIIMRTDYRKADGEGHTGTAAVHDSVADANQAARDLLLESCRDWISDHPGDGDLPEMNETNLDSATEPYVGVAHLHQDELDRVKVEVIPMEVQRSGSTQETTADNEVGEVKE